MTGSANNMNAGPAAAAAANWSGPKPRFPLSSKANNLPRQTLTNDLLMRSLKIFGIGYINIIYVYFYW